ncbi:MAG: hypothetical protein AB1807_11360 [Pseudomonadota bacterium]
MTSSITSGFAQQDLEGRSVRDVVEYSSEQVNDAWCRKIFRKILQSLELQYAMHMPHRVITPDTIVFHANGEPLLISDDIDAAPTEDARQADDLTALARVIHYAITQELAPTGPLVGRADDYSAALIATVDACMEPDPTRRPPCVDAVRNLLGIAAAAPPADAFTASEVPAPRGTDLHAPVVTGASGADMVAAPSASLAAIGSVPTGAADDRAIGVSGAPVVPNLPSSASTSAQPSSVPLSAAASAPPDAPDASVEVHRADANRGQRWAFAAGCGAIVVMVALLLSAELRDPGPRDHVASAPPQAAASAHHGLPAADSGAASTGTAATGAPTDRIANAASDDPGHPDATVTASDATVGRTASLTDPSLTRNPASDPVAHPASGSSSQGATLSGGTDPQEGTTRVKSNPTDAPETVAAKGPPAASARAAAAPLPKDGTGVRARAALPPSAVPGKASYQLQIVPWGVVYVDGVEHGVSPPLRRLALTPGRHTIRITNPKYRDSILEFESAQTTSIGKIIVEFTDATE